GRGFPHPTLPRALRVAMPRPGTRFESGSRHIRPWRAPDRTGCRRTTGRDRRRDKATPAAARRGLSMSTYPVHLLPDLAAVLRTSGPGDGLSTQKLWPRIL